MPKSVDVLYVYQMYDDGYILKTDCVVYKARSEYFSYLESSEP